MADDEDYGSARITITLDEVGVVGEARDLGLRIRRALLRATRDIGDEIRDNIQRGLAAASVSIRVDPDLRRFDAQLLTQLRSFESLNLPVRPDLTGFVERIRAFLLGEEVSIRVVPDLDDFDARVRAHRAPTVTVNTNLDTDRFRRALSGLGGIAGVAARGLQGLLTFGAIGIAAAGAAQGIGVLLAALAPAVGILAAVPAAIGGAVVALGTLKLAFLGVGDALGAALSGDSKKFNEALKGLAPAAQKAVTTFRSFVPQLKAVQQSVQQSFFRQFSGDISGALKNLLPLGSGLSKVAAQFGKAASEGLKFAATSQASAPLKAIIDGTAQAAAGLQKAIVPIAAGLLDVGAAIAEAFGKKAGDAIGNLGARFGTYLGVLAASGRAVELVRAAVTVFKQLAAVASNVGGIIAGVFKAANDVGGGLLNNLADITGRFKEFVQSAQGAEAIRGIFATVATIAAQLGPILVALVHQVGAILPAIAPIFTALGPALVNLIDSLGPALASIAPGLATLGTALANGLAFIGPALAPLGAAIGAAVAGLAPLLPLVGLLANSVGQLLAPALSVVTEALAPVISALVGALMPILPPLTNAFRTLLTALIPLGALIGKVLAGAVTSLAPLLSALATTVSGLVLAFTPLITQLVTALAPLMAPLQEAFDALVQAVMPLLPPILSLAQALAPLLGTLIGILAPILQVAAAFAKWEITNAVVPWISGVVTVLGGLIGMLTTVVGWINSFVSAAVAGFKWMYDKLVGHSIIPDLVNGIISWFGRLPGRVIGAISGLVSSIVGVFQRAASGALASARTFVADAVATVRGLPGKAKAALGNVGSLLAGAGKDLIRGMIGGIRSMAGSLASAAKDAVGGAVSGAKDLLGINSPSKVFAAIGRDTGRGFIVGLTGTAAKIRETTARLAKSITEAFKGQNTRVDDRLVAMVQAGNKKLVSLAAQRDALAEKIAAAQKFAAETTKATLQAFSLSSLVQGDGVNASTITAGLVGAVRQVKAFTSQIASLAKRGLRKDLVEQLIGLGPDQGAAVASALSKASKAQLARINDLQGQLAKSAGKFGNTSADLLYDAGKKAGDGLLAGLKAQKKSIQDLMLDIAKGMQTAIRKALKIHSPSLVMRRIGDMTGAGLVVGLLRQVSAITAAARQAARAMVGGVSSQLGSMPALTPAFGNFADPRSPGVALTRAQRLRQTGASGTPRSGSQGSTSTRTITNNFEIHEAGDGHVTAHRVINRMALAVI
ncbi:phage tail protein [Streptomyces sp. DT224]|uniref:phage tail protein n=1 Tax=Streptomyces sp. DT224 TaxID=3393426 RepID=UPI003CF856B0